MRLPNRIDTIYYYNPKFPEFGISELPLIDIKWVQSSVDAGDRYLYSVVSYHDIEYGENFDYPRTYTLYAPFADEDDVYVHDLAGGREAILCFDKEKLVKRWKKELKIMRNRLKKRLEDLEKCLSQK